MRVIANSFSSLLAKLQKMNFKLECLTKMYRFLPKHGNFELLLNEVNIKKILIHGWAQQCWYSTLNWTDYPKYHWWFWSILWLFQKSSPKIKLSTTKKSSTIGKLSHQIFNLKNVKYFIFLKQFWEFFRFVAWKIYHL